MNNDRYLRILRFVIVYWMLGWFIKWAHYSEYLFDHILRYPVSFFFFPLIFQDAITSLTLYCLPIPAFLVFFTKNPRFIRGIALMLVFCSFGLMIHQETYNDATFVTSFWVALWITWFSFTYNREVKQFPLQATVLAQCVVGLIFLGGTIGKCTPEFLSGDVLLNIFFLQRVDWPFLQIREMFSVAELHSIAKILSIIIICTEGFLSLSAIWPSRFICRLAPVIMILLIPFSTWRILSVLLGMMGMLWGCLVFKKEELEDA